MTDTFSICFTGPESSGKTTMANYLNQAFDSELVPEYSRLFLEKLNRPYDSNDLILIAERQLDMITKLVNSYSMVAIDTGVEVIKVWHEHKFGFNSSVNLLAQKQHSLIDLYVLCKPDIPWQPDPLRESENDRERLFSVYSDYLTHEKLPFVTLEGNLEERKKNLSEVIEFFF